MSPYASTRAFLISRTPNPAAPSRAAYQIPMARGLARRYGTATAARYLRKRGWSVESALWILTAHWPFAANGGRRTAGVASDHGSSFSAEG